MNKTTTLTGKLLANRVPWGDRCDSWILVDTPGLSVKQESMPPGTKEQLHFHREVQQFFFILKGSATFYTESGTAVVREQYGLLIPPGTQHYIANETAEVLEFLVISQPTTNGDRVVG